jgi:CRISPR-associated endonuclease/helicase Cas3
VAEKSQSILETLNNADIPFDSKSIARTAYIMGATHDIGKSSEFFQRYIKGDKSQKPLLKSHSPISSLFCYWAVKHDSKISENSHLLGISAALGVNGHHGSLKSPITYSNRMDNFFEEEILKQQIESIQKNSEVDKICNNLGILHFAEFSSKWQDNFESMIHDFWKFKTPVNSEPNYHVYFLTNLLFSVLLDSDRADAAKISYQRINIDENSVKRFVSNFADKPNKINKARNNLFLHLDATSHNIRLENKILSITAPTGLGKTLSSLNFAMQLRERIKSSHGFTPRIIYVAPFTSILDQNFSEFENVFKSTGQSNVLLLHHHLAPLDYKSFKDEIGAESFRTSQSELLISGWSSEIVVTTFIQLFGTVFGKSTHELRRFQNLAGSIVILDEIQSIPFEYWDAVRQTLLFLSKNYSIWFVLMTATQPLIFREDEILELVGTSIPQLPSRVSFNVKIKERKTIAEFCQELRLLIDSNPQKSILVELNTISSASEVYNFIKNEDSFYLSSHIIPNHRLPRIKEIKQRLDSNKRTILVSTQVVEAGVDLDFDLAVRDVGPIDSIVQTAGRCNRNGLKDTKESTFSIYAIKDQNGMLYSNSVYGLVSIDIAMNLLQHNNSVERLVGEYFKEVTKKKTNTKSVNINTAIEELDYDKVKTNFNLIDEQDKVSVFVEFDENAISIWKDFLSLAESERKSRDTILKIRRNMAGYMINISEKEKDRKRLQEVNGIYKIAIENLKEYYDEDVGFIKGSLQ